ncbi:MAG: cation-transporting P-type ATPase [Planctomycetaceae bacterium]
MHFTLHPRRLVDYLREERPVPHAADMLLRGARSEVPVLLGNLGTRVEGLTTIEAAQRLAQQGPNVLPGQRRPVPCCCCGARCGIPWWCCSPSCRPFPLPRGIFAPAA